TFRSGRAYAELWPNGVSAQATVQPPYDNMYLVSPEYGDGSGKIPRLSSCYFIVGLKLFCDLIGMNSHVGRVIIDGSAGGRYTLFNTFGIAAVMHPTYWLSDAAGSQIASDLCARLVHEGTLYNVSGSTPIVTATVLEQATSFLDNQIRLEFASIESRGGGQLPLQSEIERGIGDVVRRESTVEAFTKKFLSGDPNNYLGVIQDNASLARDRLLEKIANQVSTQFGTYQNLYYS